MSIIVKTEAVVLKSIDFRESSKIVTFYTRQFGKIAGMVKGARQAKSKYGSSLEPMSYVSMVLYKKAGREIQTVSNCDIMKPFRYLYDDLEKMSVGMAMIEIVNIVAHEQEQNFPLFSLLVHSLNTLNHATHNPSNLLYYFEIHMAKILGYDPTFDHCSSCLKPLKEIVDGQVYRFNFDRGGLVCSQCTSVPGKKVDVTSDVLKIFQTIHSSHSIECALQFQVHEQSKCEIENFLWAYLQHHMEGLRALKSSRVFSTILDTA